MNNTLIENLNAMMEVKKNLNQVLKNNGVDGGPVFDEYPDKFRELFRILEDTIGDIEEGPYTTHETITNVANPVITYKDNIVYITCATPGAQIYMRKDYEGWQQYILNFYITHDTFVESYAILNGVRSSTVSLLVPYQKTSVVDPPTIIRENGIVTITHPNENVALWWRIYPTSYVRYTGPISVSDTKTIVAYASYTGIASEEVWSEGTGEEINVADPVIICVDNYVSMTCETEDALIYYKIGDVDTWYQYTSPIQISVDTIFTAYAYKEGNISNTVTYTAQYEEPYIPPVVVPADPIFSISNNVVTITCSTSGATIYWREYGDIEWTEYSSGITISEDTDFEAYSQLNGETSNTIIYSAEYEEPQPETPADPVFSTSENIVTITCSTSGATIYYSTDGGNTYDVYTEPITISSNTTFYTYASKNGTNSNIVGPYLVEYISAPEFNISTNVVTITCATTGATIYYSTDGGNTYNVYSTGITISSNTTFYAYASKDEFTSDITGPYQTYYVADPVIHYYKNGFTITCDTAGIIYYSISSTTNYNVYNKNSAPYIISNNSGTSGNYIIRAYVIKNGNQSNIVSYDAYYDSSFSYGKEINPDSSYYNIPFTINMLENGNVIYSCSYSYNTSSDNFINYLLFQYKLNNNEWISLTKNDLIIERTGEPGTMYHWNISYTFNLSQNDILSIKVIQNNSNDGIFGYSNNFKITGKCNVYGNLLSLVWLSDWTEYQYHIVGESMEGLFKDSKIVSAENLIIPEYMTITDGYYEMFRDNTELINPPKIEHINFADSNSSPRHVLGYMFRGCTSLVDIPKLPAPIWDNTYYKWKNISIYQGMFYGCTSLRENIIIDGRANSTNMQNNILGSNMFSGCKSMRQIKVLLDISTNYENHWLSNLGGGLTNVYGKILLPTNTSVTTTELGVNNTNWSIEYY